MARLGSSEIIELKNCLSEWQRPMDMGAVVTHAMNCLGSHDLFNQAGLEFLRDAWIAAKFGRVRKAEKIRLVDETWPDFELLSDGQIESFEAVEADDPSRRRGIEYREGIGEIEDDPVEDWIERAEQAPMWLESACKKKLVKHYGSLTKLVIYLNLSEYGIRQTEVEACFPLATNSVRESFEEVWVLWKERAYIIWRDGRAASNFNNTFHESHVNRKI